MQGKAGARGERVVLWNTQILDREGREVCVCVVLGVCVYTCSLNSDNQPSSPDDMVIQKPFPSPVLAHTQTHTPRKESTSLVNSTKETDTVTMGVPHTH